MTKDQILQAIRQYAQENLSKAFIPGKTYIHASGPLLFPEDVEMLADAVLGFWYTEWKYAAQFSRALSNYVGYSPYVTLCNSGSSASLLAITAAIEQSKKKNAKMVVTCALGFPTTVAPIYQSGKIPLYIDIDHKTLSPRLDQLEDVISKYGKDICGVVLAHTMGFPFDERKALELARQANAWMVVDACDALGSRINYPHIKDVHVGYYSDFATLSFFPAHHITSGEGGAVLTNMKHNYEVVNSLTSWGRGCKCLPGQDNVCGKRFEQSSENLPVGWDHKYTFERLGYNLKMTDLQAALGLSQLSHIDEFVRLRQRNFGALMLMACKYNVWLQIGGASAEKLWGVVSPFGFPIYVKPEAPFTSQELIAFLELYRIGTRRMFGGNLTRQSAFENLDYVKMDLSGSDDVMERMFWISCSPSLTSEMITYIEEIFSKFMEKYL